MAHDIAHQSHSTAEARAEVLDRSQRNASPVEQLPAGVSLGEAYDIQRQLLALRVMRGEQIVGAKLGFTSKAKMAQMGVSEVIAGQLTNAMQIRAGETVKLSHFIHPRVEPEVAFRVSRDVGSGVDIALCVDAVAPSLEIIDSRYRDFQFSLSDVVADNASSAAFVIGDWKPIGEGLADQTVELLFDGSVIDTGSTAAIFGNPMDALRQLNPLIEKYGFNLVRGNVILAGAATAAAVLRPSRIEARVGNLGTVHVEAV